MQRPYIGTIPRDFDCVVPEGAKVFELHACENCVKTFLRPRSTRRALVVKRDLDLRYHTLNEEKFFTVYVDQGERYCGECKARMLMPPSKEKEDEYRDQLPRIGPHDGVKFPRYDNSIIERRIKTESYKGSRPLPIKRRERNRWHENWRQELLRAFEQRGPLSSAQINEVVGSKLSIASMVLTRIRNEFVDLKPVASVWPRKSCMGVGCKLYRVVLGYELS